MNDDHISSNCKGNTRLHLECIENIIICQDIATYIRASEEDFGLGIKLFIDATRTEIHTNWILDPVMVVYTFFQNNGTKAKRAWRLLIFVIEFGKPKSIKNKQTSSTDKCQDFHNQLSDSFSS